jgi:hypothetical protein
MPATSPAPRRISMICARPAACWKTGDARKPGDDDPAGGGGLRRRWQRRRRRRHRTRRPTGCDDDADGGCRAVHEADGLRQHARRRPRDVHDGERRLAHQRVGHARRSGRARTDGHRPARDHGGGAGGVRTARHRGHRRRPGARTAPRDRDRGRRLAVRPGLRRVRARVLHARTERDRDGERLPRPDAGGPRDQRRVRGGRPERPRVRRGLQQLYVGLDRERVHV